MANAVVAPANVPIAQIVNLQQHPPSYRNNISNNLQNPQIQQQNQLSMQLPANPSINIINPPNHIPVAPPPQQHYPMAYRNELYDRTVGYDVPRNVRNNYYANVPHYNNMHNLNNMNNPANGPRRSNLHLDFNRARPQSRQTSRQRSFDDTESCYYMNSVYSHGAKYQKYENMYERVKEEPLYQNSNNANPYGRLDVIGHGVGRIERHLSSSCTNIDHYQNGSHYAVLGHSHLGAMSQIRMTNNNPTNNKDPANNSKDTVKSFFSCLGGENSQSMQSMNNLNNGDVSVIPPPPPVQAPAPSRPMGAIPKAKNKVSPKPQPTPSLGMQSQPVQSQQTPKPIFQINQSSNQAHQIYQNVPNAQQNAQNQAQNPLNRISKSSLQYLLVNKWLPLWMGQGPDYKIIDFNFMFSRNCEDTLDPEQNQGLVRFNGQAEMRPAEFEPAREYPTMNGNYPRVIRNTPQLGRLRESEGEQGGIYQQQNCDYENLRQHTRREAYDRMTRARSDSPGHHEKCQESFRNWSFNFEDNSFRPAGGKVRRITDGTFNVKDFREQNPKKETPMIFVEPQPSTSKSSSPSNSDNSNPSESSSSKSPTNELKKSENYDNLASLQQDVAGGSGEASNASNTLNTSNASNTSTSNTSKFRENSPESNSSDTITLMDDEDEDPFDDMDSDID